MKQDFIPKRDGDLNSFEENFSTKLALYGAALNIDPEEITGTINVIEKHRTAFTKLNSKKAESKAAGEENNIEKRNSIKEMRRMAKKVKSSKAYSTNIGDDMGIIGPDFSEKLLESMKPGLIAVFNGNDVVIKFRKDSMQGVNLYSRRGAETEFNFVVTANISPYNDIRPKLDASKPEQREYYALFINDNMEIGKRSDVIKVVIP